MTTRVLAGSRIAGVAMIFTRRNFNEREKTSYF
jgi:hypothetical protein